MKSLWRGGQGRLKEGPAGCQGEAKKRCPKANFLKPIWASESWHQPGGRCSKRKERLPGGAHFLKPEPASARLSGGPFFWVHRYSLFGGAWRCSHGRYQAHGMGRLEPHGPCPKSEDGQSPMEGSGCSFYQCHPRWGVQPGGICFLCLVHSSPGPARHHLFHLGT